METIDLKSEFKLPKYSLETYLQIFEKAFEHDLTQGLGCTSVAFQVDPAHLEKIDNWRKQFSFFLLIFVDITLSPQPFIKDNDDYNRSLAFQLYSHGHMASMRIADNLDRLN